MICPASSHSGKLAMIRPQGRCHGSPRARQRSRRSLDQAGSNEYVASARRLIGVRVDDGRVSHRCSTSIGVARGVPRWSRRPPRPGVTATGDSEDTGGRGSLRSACQAGVRGARPTVHRGRGMGNRRVSPGGGLTRAAQNRRIDLVALSSIGVLCGAARPVQEDSAALLREARPTGPTVDRRALAAGARRARGRARLHRPRRGR